MIKDDLKSHLSILKNYFGQQLIIPIDKLYNVHYRNGQKRPNAPGYLTKTANASPSLVPSAKSTATPFFHSLAIALAYADVVLSPPAT